MNSISCLKAPISVIVTMMLALGVGAAAFATGGAEDGPSGSDAGQASGSETEQPRGPAGASGPGGMSRNLDPVVGEQAVDRIVEGNNAFAFDVLGLLAAEEGAGDGQGGNLVFSPYSIRVALAMLYAGAEGETAREIESALRFELPEVELHPAFNALDLDILDSLGLELSIANGLWLQDDVSFVDIFVRTLARSYGAEAELVDFSQAEEARRLVNDWVAEATADRISNLLPQGSVTRLTRMILTNAVYFNAKWAYPFRAGDTYDAPFYLSDGTEVTVPTMNRRLRVHYLEEDTLQAVSLPYAGGEFAMTFVLPAEGESAASISASEYHDLRDRLYRGQATSIDLALPKFDFETAADLIPLLRNLGVERVFRSQDADLSGIAVGMEDLFVSGVFHQANITVDEEGTTASAATGVVASVESAVPYVPLNRPFFFAIEHLPTRTMLFTGRLADPRG